MRRAAILLFILIIHSQSGTCEVPKYLQGFSQKSFYSLKTGKERIGKTQANWNLSGKNIRFIENSEIEMTLYKKAEHVSTSMTTITDSALKILDIEFVFKTGQSKIVVKGHRNGNELSVSAAQMGKNQKQTLRLKEPVVVSTTIRPFLVMKGLPEVAAEYQASFFEPSAFAIVPLKMKVTKLSEANRWQVVVEYLNQSMTSEIDQFGNLLKEKSDFAGLPVIAEVVDAARFKSEKLTGTKEDLVERARVSFKRIDQPKSLKDFSVRISGIDLSVFELTRHRQKLRKNLLFVKVENLPQKGLSVDAIKKRNDLRSNLLADAQTPVNDPTIQAKAKEIVGSEQDVWQRALKIHEFVFRYLVKEPTISMPNALQVLKSGKGDCNEHAALYTALARAAGVPTRTVVGLVYSDHFYGDPGFYYHAWVEVNTGSSWVAIDPTWNQIPADATHIAFVDGGLDKQLQITSLMGKVKLQPS